jgi:hypothetical protein
MCGKHFILFATVALLVCASTSSALDPARVIDDFEAYWGQPAIAWTEDIPVATPILMTAGAGQGNQAMDVDYAVPGGWANPGDPTNYDTLNHSSVMRTFDPIDFQAGGEIRMQIRVEPGWDADLMKTNYFLIEWTGDQWAQTLIPGPAGISPFWWPTQEYPAVIGPDGWNPPDCPGITVDTKIIHPSDGWVEIVITDDMWVPWGASLASFDAMSNIGLQLWSGWTDTTGASGTYKVDSTGGTHWPTGPLNGSIDFDYIYYIPEPMTIALLGLGGLAVLRKRR